MAHVHYQFITQPSATFPLRPRSRFPSFLGSSTPSFLLLAIRRQGDRGGKRSGQERARRRRRQSERKRKNDEENKRKREEQVETTMTSAMQRMVSSGEKGGYKIYGLASGAFTFLFHRPPSNPSACHECNLLHARKNDVHVHRLSFVVEICVSQRLSTRDAY